MDEGKGVVCLDFTLSISVYLLVKWGLFSPLVGAAIRCSGEILSSLETLEGSVSLPPQPAIHTVSLSSPPAAPTPISSCSQAALCSVGTTALAAEAAQRRCARVSVLSPAGPGAPGGPYAGSQAAARAKGRR